jgi:hypothetical protein
MNTEQTKNILQSIIEYMPIILTSVHRNLCEFLVLTKLIIFLFGLFLLLIAGRNQISSKFYLVFLIIFSLICHFNNAQLLDSLFNFFRNIIPNNVVSLTLLSFLIACPAQYFLPWDFIIFPTLIINILLVINFHLIQYYFGQSFGDNSYLICFIISLIISCILFKSIFRFSQNTNRFILNLIGACIVIFLITNEFGLLKAHTSFEISGLAKNPFVYLIAALTCLGYILQSSPESTEIKF